MSSRKKMSFIKIKTISWHYEIHGSGEPILFLHGWGGSLRIWEQQVESFLKKYKVLTIDLPGHGKTEWREVDLEKIAQGISGLLNHLKMNKINFVGNSVGGLLGLKLFELHPEVFKRFVLVDSLPKFLKSKDFPFGLERERIEKLNAQLDTDYPAIVDIFFRSLFVRQERQDGKLSWLMKFRQQDDLPQKEALKKVLDILMEGDLRDTFKKLSVPVLIINGTGDYICSQEAILFLQKELPTACVHFIKNTGHFPFLTKPKEFNEILEGFLRSW